MKKLEIKMSVNDENKPIRAIFVDGELFDWGLIPGDLKRARDFAKNNPLMRKAVYGDLQQYFLNCFSKFLGRAVTIKELNDSIDKGWIE